MSPIPHVSPVQVLSIKVPVHKEFWLTIVYTYIDINENSPLTCELYIFLKNNYTYLTSMSKIVSTHNIGTYYLPIYTIKFPPLKITLTCKLVEHFGEFPSCRSVYYYGNFSVGESPRAGGNPQNSCPHINYVKQCTHRLLSTIEHLLEKCKEIFVFLHGHMDITKKIALLTLNTWSSLELVFSSSGITI